MKELVSIKQLAWSMCLVNAFGQCVWSTLLVNVRASLSASKLLISHIKYGSRSSAGYINQSHLCSTGLAKDFNLHFQLSMAAGKRGGGERKKKP
jgi:hypothetical protein